MSYIFASGYGYSKKLCQNVTTWFLNEFFPRHKITVEIVHRGLKREHVVGYCSVTDCDWRPRSFLIEIQSHLNEEEYIKTLLHELQHCYQHIRGDLRDKRGIRCWKGIDCSDLDYHQMPWEQETHQKEEELYQKYVTVACKVYQ